MTKWLGPTLALLFLVFLVFILVGAARAAGADPKLSQVLGPTVLMDLGGGSCTGELVYSKRDDKSGDVTTIILTAKHCADATGLVNVIIPAYDKTLRKTSFVGYTAKLRGKSSTADIALFELQDKATFFADTARLAPKEVALQIGEPVWSVGYPLGGEKTITEGLLGSRQSWNDTEYLRATPDIAPGNSGGGLYHKNAAGDFELIGVTVVMARGFSFMTGSVPIDAIQDYLKVALPKDAAAIAGGPK